MSAEVRILSGMQIASVGHPDANVVAELERLLAEAKDGYISGLSYAITYSDHSVGGRFIGEICRSQVGSLFATMVRMSASLDGDQ